MTVELSVESLPLPHVPPAPDFQGETGSQQNCFSPLSQSGDSDVLKPSVCRACLSLRAVFCTGTSFRWGEMARGETRLRCRRKLDVVGFLNPPAQLNRSARMPRVRLLLRLEVRGRPPKCDGF